MCILLSLWAHPKRVDKFSQKNYETEFGTKSDTELKSKFEHIFYKLVRLMALTFIAHPWNGLAYQKLLVNTVNLKGLARGHKYEIWKIIFFIHFSNSAKIIQKKQMFKLAKVLTNLLQSLN